jgi:hypothetical protein
VSVNGRNGRTSMNAYVIKVSLDSPMDFKVNQNYEFLSTVDLHAQKWTLCAIYENAMVFDFDEAVKVSTILNKMNRSFFSIVPVGTTVIKQSKMNDYAEELEEL